MSKTKIEYRKVGDYYLPNIVVPEENIEIKGKDIGKYENIQCGPWPRNGSGRQGRPCTGSIHGNGGQEHLPAHLL